MGDANTPDTLAFLLIVLLARRTRAPGLKAPMILDVIAKDATWYFLVIFSSHLVLVLTINLARVSSIVSLSTSHQQRQYRLSSQRSNFFQDRKSSSIYPKNDWPKCTIFAITSGIVVYVSVQPLPFVHTADAPDDSRYLPVMISRIMLSLRKAAGSQRDVWSLLEPTTGGTNIRTIQFFPQRDTTWREDGIPLETFPTSRTAI